MTERTVTETTRVLIVGAALGLLGGNVYRRWRRRANFRRARDRFGTSEWKWTARDFVDYKWHMRRIELTLAVERILSGMLTLLTLGLWRREDLMCCDTEVHEDNARIEQRMKRRGQTATLKDVRLDYARNGEL